MARKEVRGFEVEACVRCGAVLMDASDLDVIAAGGEDVRTPIPVSTATPSAPPPRWIHKDPSPPQPLYTQAPLPPDPPTEETQAPTVVDRSGLTSEPPPKREAKSSSPVPVPKAPAPVSQTPRSAGPRRRTPKPAVPRTPTPPPAPPIFRDSQRRGSSPTLMPDVAPAGEPGLGDFGKAASGSQGPGFDLPRDPDATEEMERGQSNRKATPVSQKMTAPRPPHRAPAALDDPTLTEWTRKRSRTRRRLVQVAVITWLAIFVAFAVVGYLAWQRGALIGVGLPGPQVSVEPTLPDVTSTVPNNDMVEPPSNADLLPAEGTDAQQPTPTATGGQFDRSPTPAAQPPVLPGSPQTPQPDTTVAPNPTSQPTASDLPAPQPEPEPEPEPTVAPTPEPAAEPAPSPQPVAPAPSGRQSRIDRGWSLVESNPVAAAAEFDQVMANNPSDAEANYGYGYSLIRQGNPETATFYLCRSLAGANTETRREVTALIGRNGLTCD